MAEVPQFVLYEHAAGYVLLRVKEFEDIGLAIPEVEEAIGDAQRFCTVVKLEAFESFKNTEAALENCVNIAEGRIHPDLLNFLEANLPRRKKKVVTVGVSDPKLASSIGEQLDNVKCFFTGVVPELMRGVRIHFERIAQHLPHHSLSKAQLSLGHSYSRSKIKFDVHRVDNMVIQSIALLDQMDKDINLFGMRIREWYSYHFPELFKLVPDQFNYVSCACVIMDRKNIDESVIESLKKILQNDEKVAEVVEAARTSMGMDISELDLLNVERFAIRVKSLSEYRQRLHEYIKDRMHSCAPSLSALIGEQVGARLISHAGSLTNLAKYPASTVQILGAEKALFRALKTRSNTPKYGLLFHSSFIGRASAKNKGRISRFLANKCTVASRIDCFSDVPVATFGEHLKQQVEDRLKFLETGEVPKKNLDVMKEAIVQASEVQMKILKKRKKAAKKAKEKLEAKEEQVAESHQMDESESPKNSKKRKRVEEEALDESMETNKKKRKRQLISSIENEPPQANGTGQTGEMDQAKKKHKKHKKESSADDVANNGAGDGDVEQQMERSFIETNHDATKEKKKKKKKRLSEE